MRPLIPIVICFFLFCVACKKSHETIDYDQGTGNCRISGFHDEPYNTRTFKFEYGADNRLARIRYLYTGKFGEFTSFAYEGNRIIVYQLDSAGAVGFQDTVYTNEFGLVDSIIHESEYTKYFYNALHQLVSTVTRQQIYVCQFFWDANGNLAGTNTGQGTSYFGYYDNIPTQLADCQELYDFMNFGALSNKSKWLTNYSEYNDQGYHKYTRDADGKILSDSCRHQPSDPQPYNVRTIEYECN